MKVILLQDVKKIGKKDQTVEVSDGYAVNFLFPRKLAVQLSKKSQEVLDSQKEHARQLDEQNRLDAMELAKKLEKIEINIRMKVGKNSRLFGNVSLKQVEEILANQYGIKIDKRKFIDKGPLDTLGFYKLKIELYKGVIGQINVHVIGE